MTGTLPEILSEREQEILTCLADGLSNQEIANKLYLAAQTVRYYSSQLYAKLGVSNRHEAVERAQALGLLSEASPSPIITGKHNLPAQATPFIGRQHELVELANLLKNDDIHLVTILAPGGMGKTRLALEAAHLQIGRYADGVIFVPLAPLGNPNDIVTAIAENIGFVFHGENAPAQQLIDFLRERSLLLVLDNFEHLLDGAQLVADLMQVAPNVRILTTSRERLNLRGETVYTLRGLDFPTWETPEDALQYDAVKLFMQSAHRVRPDFELQARGLDFLARICRLTAGMPLGIELAAGWVDVLSLEQIATEIQKGIDILETEMRDVPERQRSIRATFDYTWERLTADEQMVFIRLSVFRGGFTVQAAESVAGAGVRSLRQLANKALVQVSPDGRHDIHELLRQFGVEKLASSGEQPTIQAKHAAYFADFMAERKQGTRDSHQLTALELIDHDFENVRSAWQYDVHDQRWDQLPKFLVSLSFYCDIRTREQEAIELFEYAANRLQSMKLTSESELALGRVLARLGLCYVAIGFLEKAASILDEAIRILRQHDSPDDLMAAFSARQSAADYLLQFDVRETIIQEGLYLARSISDRHWESHFLVDFASANTNIGNVEKGFSLTEAPLAFFRQCGDRYGLMLTYGEIGRCYEYWGDYDTAKTWYQQCLINAEAFGKGFLIGVVLTILGRIAVAEADYTSAQSYLRQAIEYLSASYKHMLGLPLVDVVRVFANQGKLEYAVELLPVIQKYPAWSNDTADVAKTSRNQLETNLEPERFAAAWERGEKRELSTVVADLLKELRD